MEQNTTQTFTQAVRPSFITVLCILSFVGIGIYLIADLSSYFTYSAKENQDILNTLKSDGGQDLNPAMNDMMGALGLVDYEKQATYSLISALLNIPILIGVLFMWKQRKVGFWIYTIFETSQAIIPFVMGLGLITLVKSMIVLMFAIIFIVLYAINLKHLK